MSNCDEAKELDQAISEFQRKEAHLFQLFNKLCKKFDIDKVTSLQLAQIKITPTNVDKIANEIKACFMDKNTINHINDIEFILKSLLHRNIQ